MRLDEFFEYMESRHNYGEFIVRLAYKYAIGKTWIITNEHLEYNYQEGMWEWMHDWDEGFDDVEVLGYIEVQNITEFTKRWSVK